MSTTSVGVKLDEDTRERLKKLGEVRQRSAHWLMKEAIARYLETEERYERERAEDLLRWQHYVDTGKAIPHEQVKQRLARLRAGAAGKTPAG